MDRLEIDCQKAVEEFGAISQCIVAIEELAELQKELTKFLRGKTVVEHLKEELADVMIMTTQLIKIFGYPQDELEAKLDRLEMLMEEG